MLVGNDIVTAQKKFIGAFKFRNYAKLMFSTNQPPEPKNDQSHAFFRRWLLITCPRIFQGEDQDPAILHKLTTPEELSGLLNLAIDQLHILLVNGGFKETQTTEQIRESYMRKADPVKAFTQDWLLEDENGFIEKKELYNYYTKYCNINNFSPEGKTKFLEAFSRLGIQTLHETRIKNKRGFAGMAFSEYATLPKMPKKQVSLSDKSSRGKKKSIKDSKKSGIFGKQEEGKFCCWICKKIIGEQSELSNLKGRPAHKSCVLELEEGRKNE